MKLPKQIFMLLTDFVEQRKTIKERDRKRAKVKSKFFKLIRKSLIMNKLYNKFKCTL